METTSPLFVRVNEENTLADGLFDAWREITSPLFGTTAEPRPPILAPSGALPELIT